MAIKTKIKDVEFGIGDVINVFQKITEGEKSRTQVFEGTVISIKGRGENQSFMVRKVGAQNIGIERIFPVIMPSIIKIEIVRKGGSGVRRAKLYYIRDKSRKEIEKIYTRKKKKTSSKKKKTTLKKVKRSNR